MNEEIKQLAKLHDENIELRKEIENLKSVSLEVVRGYARLQIKKDRDRIKTISFAKKTLNKKFEIVELIDETPIILD